MGLCQSEELQSEPEIIESHEDDADECHSVKQLLLESNGEEEFKRALEKVKVLCH